MKGPAIFCAPSLKEMVLLLFLSDFLVLKIKEKILILYESFLSEAKESDLHNKSNLAQGHECGVRKVKLLARLKVILHFRSFFFLYRVQQKHLPTYCIKHTLGKVL